MKTKEEIDELYHKYWDEFSNKYDDNLHYYSFVEGYTQCQEDIADKKYTEKDVINIVNKSRETGLTAEYLILQLNKQD